ncbi:MULTISPECIES: cell division protein ZapE [unclassified Microbacterium]|uniref:cell division protein ZapE n=1 Tax=unclassified Microbacterium TaxID=2609290 RepID=UPI00214D0227|nr:MULTISPECIES: cell division protein ZapE [unclassified Microbacterium]MCR2783910.1 cell division protein ZapE [Microbacterium sp. zg.B96]WIM15245.1 cell division protein ZapE [Microbacterium sp. zg-B96]
MKRTDELVRAVAAAASADGCSLDPAQRATLDRLAVLGGELTGGSVRRGSARSLYVHGDAGRGKSWLADAFYAALPIQQKTRVHFHGFFDELHRSIHNHRSERDAVERAIDDVAGSTRLLFFDELHVHDSGDARLLTRLLDHVFARGLTVLATSNYAPDDLLPNPIWHHIFEPGIALIKANMEVWPLNGPIDYRTVTHNHTRGFAAGTWSTATPPLRSFQPRSVTVRGRSFPVASTDNGELTATFDQLCRTPTSTVEYLQWAREFSRWSITEVPAFSAADPEAQQRFINLVDVLVDADVPVGFSAAVYLDDFLADASRRPDAFRMASRLRLLRNAGVPKRAAESPIFDPIPLV